MMRAAAAALTAVLTGASCSGAGSGAQAPPASFGTQLNSTLPDWILDLPLQRADGAWTNLRAFQGRTVMIADYLTLCSEICPLITANTVALGRRLDTAGLGRNVALLEITVDPQRDTPHRMRAYQRLFADAPANWQLLRARPADTAAFWRYFGIDYKRAPEDRPRPIDWLTNKPVTYDVPHLDALIFLDKRGRERFVVTAQPDATQNPLPATLKNFLTGEGLGNLNKPDPIDSWTTAQAMTVVRWLDASVTSAG